MANTKSAKKAIRVQLKKTVKNLEKKLAVRSAKKIVTNAIMAKDKTAAAAALSNYQKTIGKASKKNGYLHKNTAARYVSNLSKKVNAIA